jgi:UDP-N-acetylmuramate: L-alanyl-gamma-D-glutamyl-meso-diaminopimelate ligase
VVDFGSDSAAYRAQGGDAAFDVLVHGTPAAKVDWQLTGRHNQLNALAAMAAADHVGISPQVAAQALHAFQNVKRRMEVKGVAAGVTVYDDFAHHPTAIRTTLDGLRTQIGPQVRILAVLEPRSNTMKLGAMKAQLPWALEPADLAYCHGKDLDWDVASALGERAYCASDLEALVTRIAQDARPGDHILCMSNGSFGGIHGRLLEALGSRT